MGYSRRSRWKQRFFKKWKRLWNPWSILHPNIFNRAKKSKSRPFFRDLGIHDFPDISPLKTTTFAEPFSYQHENRGLLSTLYYLVHHQGFEPWTPWLRVRCSASWANGAHRIDLFWADCCQRKQSYHFILSMSRIFFAYFFFFQLFFLLSLGCWFISYLNLRFCFLEQANRELVQTLCAIWCMVFCQEYNLKHDSQKKSTIDQKAAKAALQEFYKTASQISYLRN